MGPSFHSREAKQLSKQWKHPGLSKPKKAKTVPSAERVITSSFWDADRILMVYFPKNGESINGIFRGSKGEILTQVPRETQLLSVV